MVIRTSAPSNGSHVVLSQHLLSFMHFNQNRSLYKCTIAIIAIQQFKWRIHLSQFLPDVILCIRRSVLFSLHAVYHSWKQKGKHYLHQTLFAFIHYDFMGSICYGFVYTKIKFYVKLFQIYVIAVPSVKRCRCRRCGHRCAGSGDTW